MHPEAHSFVAAHVPPLTGLAVAEVGSYDVNGSVRGLFAAAASYTGYDVREGPGVDRVADLASWPDSAPLYDIVVSTEALEHAANPAALVAGMARALVPGGLLILTCASPERAPHGCDGNALPADEPYQGIAPAELLDWCAALGLRVLRIEHHPARGDLYLAALKGGAR